MSHLTEELWTDPGLKEKECASGSPLFLNVQVESGLTGPPPGSSQAKKKPPLKKKLTTKLSYTRLYVVGVSTPFFREGTLVMGVSTSMPSEQKPDWLYIVDVGSSIPFQEVESCSYTPYILGVRQTARDVHKKNIGVWVPKYSV